MYYIQIHIRVDFQNCFRFFFFHNLVCICALRGEVRYNAFVIYNFFVKFISLPVDGIIIND